LLFGTVAPALVIAISCFWLAVWAVCLLLTLRFVVILVAAGVMQGYEALRSGEEGSGKREE
jgi:hypothetical protein